MVFKMFSVEPLDILEAARGTRSVLWAGAGMSPKQLPLRLFYIFELYRKLDLEKWFLTLRFTKHCTRLSWSPAHPVDSV